MLPESHQPLTLARIARSQLTDLIEFWPNGANCRVVGGKVAPTIGQQKPTLTGLGILNKRQQFVERNNGNVGLYNPLVAPLQGLQVEIGNDAACDKKEEGACQAEGHARF
ncbi:hypothetical protein N185_31775 [Sinorhizobium sp. GW3]|nr:hypothetical protein N185_31775 [Sinorhizobium sp. GW3]